MNKKLRLLVAASLVLFALLSAVWTLLLPDHFADPHDGLLAIADAGGTARIAVLALSLSQLACIIAFAGVAAWLYPTSPKLATIGGTLTVLGGFGHAVFSGAEMARQVMAVDPDVNASVAGQLQSFPPLMPFMMVGLIGTVLGLVLLGIAHLRSGAARVRRCRVRWQQLHTVGNLPVRAAPARCLCGSGRGAAARNTSDANERGPGPEQRHCGLRESSVRLKLREGPRLMAGQFSISR